MDSTQLHLRNNDRRRLHHHRLGGERVQGGALQGLGHNGRFPQPGQQDGLSWQRPEGHWSAHERPRCDVSDSSHCIHATFSPFLCPRERIFPLCSLNKRLRLYNVLPFTVSMCDRERSHCIFSTYCRTICIHLVCLRERTLSLCPFKKCFEVSTHFYTISTTCIESDSDPRKFDNVTTNGTGMILPLTQ